MEETLDLWRPNILMQFSCSIWWVVPVMSWIVLSTVFMHFMSDSLNFSLGRTHIHFMSLLENDALHVGHLSQFLFASPLSFQRLTQLSWNTWLHLAMTSIDCLVSKLLKHTEHSWFMASEMATACALVMSSLGGRWSRGIEGATLIGLCFMQNCFSSPSTITPTLALYRQFLVPSALAVTRLASHFLIGTTIAPGARRCARLLGCVIAMRGGILLWVAAEGGLYSQCTCVYYFYQ